MEELLKAVREVEPDVNIEDIRLFVDESEFLDFMIAVEFSSLEQAAREVLYLFLEEEI